MTDKMLIKKEGAVGYLIYNNPERRNAMSQEMTAAIPGLIDELEGDPAIRVIVVTGAGGKAFVSGADISEFEAKRHNAEAAAEYAAQSAAARHRMTAVKLPTISMIRGFCMGGGLAVAMNTDIRIATEESKFGIPAAKLGIVYGPESVRHLMELVGPAYAKEILYLGKQYSAAEALAMGLINHVVADGELEGYVSEMANTIAVNAPLSVAATRQIVNELLKDAPDMDMCDGLVSHAFNSVDYAEGRKAFMEKRKPVFTGR